MRFYSWFGLLNPAQGSGEKSLTFRGAEPVFDIQGSLAMGKRTLIQAC